ncbi:DUF5959 family protein [Streptomyces sp. ZS0098]|uniref:DUF5959 family protein n=1 Tax=Streptomyces sp. ZS0098 TaxID=1904044 RepID=UPI00287B8470|nr:DUF5959 family protein [Streptomyces sp. ZS0098]
MSSRPHVDPPGRRSGCGCATPCRHAGPALQVSSADLDEWERRLDALQADEGAEWPAGDGTAWQDVVSDDPVEVTVHDSAGVGGWNGTVWGGCVPGTVTCWSGSSMSPGTGGVHAFVLDTVVAERCRGGGVGTSLVRLAAERSRAAGCQWLHVDFEERLRAFYVDACGFRTTAAGLIAL